MESNQSCRILPIPTPSINTLFRGTNKAISYAHVPTNQILYHFSPLVMIATFIKQDLKKI
jgi:hypothetical protein